MNMKGICKWAVLAVGFVAIALFTSPFGLPPLRALQAWSAPDFAEALDALSQGFGAYAALAVRPLFEGEAALLALWALICAASVSLYGAYRNLYRPGRVASGSPLGGSRIVEDKAELRRRCDFWDGKDVPGSVGLVLSGSREGYLYNGAVPHWLCVAKTGAGKSQLMVIETLHLLMAAGANVLVTGKSELVELTGEKAEALGYKRVVFDLDGYPGASSYNPLDLVAQYAEEGNRDAAQKTARQTAADLVPLGGEANAYFPKAARSALSAVILIVAYADIDRARKNMASVYEIVSRGTAGEGKDPSAPLKDYIKGLGEAHPAFGPASDFLSDGGQTTAGKNVLSTLKEALTIFGDAGIRAVTSESTHSMHELVHDKTVVYFHLLEQGDPYQVVYACFFNQWWRVAQAEARGNGGRLPRETAIVGDEWGNLGKVECTDAIATLGRSMKLHLFIFVQDLKQLNAYNRPGDNGAGRDKILGSIGGKVALSLANPEDFAYFTGLVGKRTVRTYATSEQSRGVSRTGTGKSFNEQADDLVHPWEWQNRVAVRDGSICIVGGENGAPGREGVYRMPLNYANKTPAGRFFGLGDEEFEHKKRLAFLASMERRFGGAPAADGLFWCPEFEEPEDEGDPSVGIEADEFSAWD